MKLVAFIFAWCFGHSGGLRPNQWAKHGYVALGNEFAQEKNGKVAFEPVNGLTLTVQKEGARQNPYERPW